MGDFVLWLSLLTIQGADETCTDDIKVNPSLVSEGTWTRLVTCTCCTLERGWEPGLGVQGALRGCQGPEEAMCGLACSNLGLSLFLQITAQQIAAQGQPQKVTYATQPALKTQFLTTPISQAQKLAGTQQVQTQIQVSARAGTAHQWSRAGRGD